MKRKGRINYEEILKLECDVVVNHVNNRYSKGLNTNIYVIGLSGTGKSSTSQRLSEKIVEARKQNNQVMITDSFLNFLRAIRFSKEGDIIIIEEVSVLFPSRRAMAKENVNIGKVMDTCRKKMLCIISNAPLWNTIDSHMRAMGHLIIETLKINKKYQIVISKFHRLQTNPLTGKTYRHTMKRNGRDVNRLVTKKPNQEKWDEYERGKDKFMNELYKRMEFEQKQKNLKLEKEMMISSPKIRELTQLELQVHQLVNVQGLKQTEAAMRLGKKDSQISKIIQNIKKKSVLPRENEEIGITNVEMEARK